MKVKAPFTEQSPMVAGGRARSTGGKGSCGEAGWLAGGLSFMVDTRACLLPQGQLALTRCTVHPRLAHAGSPTADRGTTPSAGAAKAGTPHGGARTSGTLGVLPPSGGVASGRREVGPDSEVSAALAPVRAGRATPRRGTSRPKCVAECRFEHSNLQKVE
jgi:hypothetical protein